MLSAQKTVEFVGSHYDDIKKVYSIWICMDGSKGQSGINRYEFTERHLLHRYKEKQSNYDLMNVVMIYLGKEEKADRLQELLWLFFKENISVAEKKDKLKQDYKITLVDDMEGELGTVCNLGMGILEEGREEGRKEGKLEAIIGLLKNGVTIDVIAKSLQVTVDYVKEVAKQNKLI